MSGNYHAKRAIQASEQVVYYQLDIRFTSPYRKRISARLAAFSQGRWFSTTALCLARALPRQAQGRLRAGSAREISPLAHASIERKNRSCASIAVVHWLFPSCPELFSSGNLFRRQGAGEFPPRDQFDFLLRKNLPELIAGEEVEVALPPGCAPGGAFAGSGALLVVVVTRMDH